MEQHEIKENVMSEESEHTDEHKKRVYRELCTFLNDQVREAHKQAKIIDSKFRKWEKVRENAIKILGDSAEFTKELNNEACPLQAALKCGSAIGKAATFCGPVPAVAGAMTSVTMDICYAYWSTSKAENLEKIAATVFKVLDEDQEATAELFNEMKKTKRISESMKDCIKKFHSGTKMGFFDNVTSLQSFANTIKSIRDVNNLKGLIEFMNALREETEGLVIMELTLTIPEILCSFGILGTGGVASGVAGGVLRGLTVFGVVADVYDVITKISKYDTYPKGAEQLLKIKKELEDAREKIRKMKKEFPKQEKGE